MRFAAVRGLSVKVVKERENVVLHVQGKMIVGRGGGCELLLFNYYRL